MSEFNIEVQGGSSVRLPTAGKYCDRDIIVTASGGDEDLNSKNLFYYEDYDEEGYPHTMVITKSVSTTEVENGRAIPKLFPTHYYGFSGTNERITKVVLPEDVNVINSSLVISRSVEELSVWDNLIYIGNYGFQYHNNLLKTIKTFPPNLVFLGDYAFHYANVRDGLPPLPDCLTNIGASCFLHTWSSAPIIAFPKLPNNLVNIGASAFSNNGFGMFPETLHIPATVKTIGNNAFKGAICNTKTVIFDGTPDSIGTGALNDIKKATGIKDIYVPWSIEDPINSNAPWDAAGATIHYNTTYDADGNPIVMEGE